MTDPSIRAMASEYVLGVLEDEDRTRFEEALERDPQLRALVDELKVAASVSLSSSLPAATPSPAFRARVLERMQGAGPASAVPSTESTSTPPPTANRGQVRAVRSGPPTWIPWALAAGLAALALGLGASRQSLQSDLALARAEAGEAAQALASTQAQLAQLDSLLAPLRGEDLRFASLTVEGDDPSMRLFWSPSAGRIVYAVNNLPPAAPGRVYQLWGIPDGGAPVSLGVFDTNANGQALALAEVTGDTPFQISAVTDEPAGGSPAPTTTPFLAGAWQVTDGDQ